MIVNFEFLGNEPIENVITCMNFKVDKVVFFGYKEVIARQEKNAREFLNDYCGVHEISFHTLEQDNLQSMVSTMREQVKKELDQNNDLYFDITGGESMILVAFGMLAKEFQLPMHMYKVEKNKLIELDNVPDVSIRTGVEKTSQEYTLADYIRMRGGCIKSDYRDEGDRTEEKEFVEEVNAMWEVAHKYREYWNPLSDFMRKHMVPDENLTVNVKVSTIANELRQSNNILKSTGKLNEILSALKDKGMLCNYSCEDGRYYYRFKNADVKDWLWKSGSILELYVFLQEKKKNADCCVGVYLDWDGIIQPQPGLDVFNEIDVLTLQDNVLTFISCKSGKLAGNQALHAMYELETVAERFGGKYARKVLAIAYPLSEAYRNRASEMGIEIRQV